MKTTTGHYLGPSLDTMDPSNRRGAPLCTAYLLNVLLQLFTPPAKIHRRAFRAREKSQSRHTKQCALPSKGEAEDDWPRDNSAAGVKRLPQNQAPSCASNLGCRQQDERAAAEPRARDSSDCATTVSAVV